MASITLENLNKTYPNGFVSVKNLSLHIEDGEFVTFFGPSGCGKSTIGRQLVGLEKPTDGTVYYKDHDLGRMNRKDVKPFRTKLQMVFQDPYGSLNPRKTIGWILEEPLRVRKMGTKEERKARVLEMLETVHLSEELYSRYPRELSGGQRQRVSLAQALLRGTKFILLDEALSALDVTVQAQMIRLLKELQEKQNLCYLFVSHDLDVVSQICDRVLFIKDGKVIETTGAIESK